MDPWVIVALAIVGFLTLAVGVVLCIPLVMFVRVWRENSAAVDDDATVNGDVNV